MGISEIKNWTHSRGSGIREFASRHGIANTAFNIGYKITNRFITAMVLKVVILTMDSVNRSLIADEDDRWRFLSREELERFGRSDPSLDLDEEFLSQAFARGDRCYAFVQDGVLGAYGWYSNIPTPISHGLTIQFDPNYVYMFKGFTAHAFRGMRLHGIGMARAMQAFVAEGSKGLISYVEAHNQDSLKSCERIGYKTIGTAFVAGGKGAYLSFSSFGCKPFGFRVRTRKAG